MKCLIRDDANTGHGWMSDIDDRVAFLRDNQAWNREDQGRGAGEKVVARCEASLGVDGRLFKVFNRRIVGNFDREQAIVVRHQLRRKVQMHQHLQDGEAGTCGCIDRWPAGGVPPTAEKPRTLSVKRDEGGFYEPMDDHAAMP